MITVVGSLNMDLVVNTERIPRPGETVLGRSFKQVPGGKGANQADAIAKLGGVISMIGAVGDDPMGRTLLDSLLEDGVDISPIRITKEAATGIASIIVEDSGNNAITVAPGANFALSPEDILDRKEVITSAEVVLTQLENPLPVVAEALSVAKEACRLTILNPAPAAELSDEILNCADILTPNETELEVLSGHPADTEENIRLAAKRLMDRGVRSLVVTLGSKGCMYFEMIGTELREAVYPAYSVNAVDTTAAGDSFNGALALFLSEGKSMEEAIHFAMMVGALSVMKEGAQTSLPTRDEVETFARARG